MAPGESGLMERPVGLPTKPSSGAGRSLYIAHNPQYDIPLASNRVSGADASPGGRAGHPAEIGSSTSTSTSTNGGARASGTPRAEALAANAQMRSVDSSSSRDDHSPARSGVTGAASSEASEALWREVHEGELEHLLVSLEDRFAGELGFSYEVTEANARVLLAYGARRGQITRLFRSQPDLASRPFGDAMRDKAELLASFRVAGPAFLKAMSRSLDWLSAPGAHAASVLEFLDRDLGVNNLARVVCISPHVLAQPIDRLRDTVAFLRTDLALGEEVGAALERNPALLGATSPRGGGGGGGRGEVVAKLEGLRGLLRLRRSVDVLPLVQRSPPLLSASTDAARETFQLLVTILGEEAATEVAIARPQVLALPPTAMKEPLAQLVRRFGGTETATAMISASNASLLRRKWERTLGKLDFVTGAMGRDLRQVAEWPAVLSCNLQTRLKRRYDALRAAGLGGDEPLRAMFGCSDGVFERRFGVTLPSAVKGKRGRKPKP